MPQKISFDKNKVYWYVMLHPDPALIDHMLQQELAQREQNGGRQFLYIVPYKYLESAPDARELRGDLHSFVFIQTTRRDLDYLLSEDWNTKTRLRLHFMRSHSGRPIRLSEQQMSPFIALFVEHRQKYSFRPITADIAPTTLVHIRQGLFKGYDATIVQVRQRGGELRLTLSIPVFSNEVALNLFECPASDVEVPGGEVDQIFRPYFLREMELRLLDILRRRVYRRETDQTRKRDEQQLSTYALFHYLTFDDPAEHRHFQALLLLCAALGRDKALKSTLLPLIREHLPSTGEPTTDEQAFMTAILFVATRKGPLRKSLKDYCQARTTAIANSNAPDLSPSLRSILPLIKDISSR